jgi:hypothetical protein
MPHVFSQSEHPFDQCEHFNQIERKCSIPTLTSILLLLIFHPNTRVVPWKTTHFGK